MRSNKQNGKSQLKELFDKHSCKSFPEVVSNEELYDIKGELALYDGHVAGFVSSYLQNAPVNPELVKVDLNLRRKMNAFQPKTPEEKNSIKANVLSWYWRRT